MARKISRQKGFTVVEMLIAMSVFAVAMTLVTTGVIYIGRQYQQGATRVKLQEATREIHQQIGDSIRYSSEFGVKPNIAGKAYICAANKVYEYQVPTATFGSWGNYLNMYYKNDNSSLDCPDSPTDASNLNAPTINKQNLLPSNAKLASFTYDETTHSLQTTFFVGDSDLIDPTSIWPDVKCKQGAGKEWCSVTSLTSIIGNRMSTN